MTSSLRVRLLTVILLPLVIVASLLGYWRFVTAQTTATDVFDRALISAALAIARDVSNSGGDALHSATRDLIANTAGGEVFYHVTGPNGDYITGYAYPPTNRSNVITHSDGIITFDASYRQEPVHAVRIKGDGRSGAIRTLSEVQVWQAVAVRQSLANQLALRSLTSLGTMLIALAVAIWLGVQVGLRPLDSLQSAIQRRSADDLSPIRRPVPAEVTGIVATLNRLFKQVQDSLSAHQSFISDAAHQLRNPAASTLALAEALADAKSDEDRQALLQELLDAARASARTTAQLLSMERVAHPNFHDQHEPLDLNSVIQQALNEYGSKVLQSNIALEVSLFDQPAVVYGNRMLLVEALKNLLHNALVHGGSQLTQITVLTERDSNFAMIRVQDNGQGIDPTQLDQIFDRFKQAKSSPGSGLGLTIARTAVERNGGQLRAIAAPSGACFELSIPLAESP
ncbi:MAG: sensor histidine kinase [Gammaproteobacteria bacterium]|nr:sensor histidine kinase [Gammaproteobacteria bacterium]